MKLSEILVTSDYPVEGDMKLALSIFPKSKLVVKISSTLELRKSPVKDKERPGVIYLFVKSNEVVGYLQLGKSVKIAGKTYDTVEFIYVIPEIRKTAAVGAFIIALTKNLPHPIILGSDEWGGIIFRDGLKLVKSLDASSRTTVKILNMKTGELSRFNTAKARGPGLTLVFEDEYDFPLTFYKGRNKYFFFENAESTPRDK